MVVTDMLKAVPTTVISTAFINDVTKLLVEARYLYDPTLHVCGIRKNPRAIVSSFVEKEQRTI